MGGRQIRPAGVYNAVSLALKNPLVASRYAEPPWFRIVNAIPPSETLVRPLAVRHNLADKRTKKLYQPKKIVYKEDALRTNFYRDHPWELARPRVVMEIDGKDYQRCDWSKGLRQPGIPLTGECVVQRQMWLMHNQQMNKRQAYDTARREFYRLRQLEEIEQRVALEEAKYVGAYFGKSRLDVGMLLEDKEFEHWKVWAGRVNEQLESDIKASLDTFEAGEEEVSEGETPEVARGAVAEAPPA